jgi:hypothetical protein
MAKAYVAMKSLSGRATGAIRKRNRLKQLEAENVSKKEKDVEVGPGGL